MTCNKGDKNSGIRFFKIITTTSLEAGKLKLPNGFTRKHGGDLPNPVFLKPPDDKEWKIYWTKHDDGYIWFEKGWKEFASYYSHDHGHLVLFEYMEASQFEVHIFDKSTLEIEYPFNDPVQNLDERTPCKKRRLKSPVSFPQPSKKLRTGTRGNVGRSSNLPKLPQHVKGQGAEFDKSKFESASKELDENVDGGSLECLKRKELTKQSSFKVAMRPAYFNYYLRVPSEFAKRHLKNKLSDIILLVMNGRTWPVKYLVERGIISAGWKKFVSDNNLKVGDVCHFELTKSLPLSFKVSIFPPRGESDQPHFPPPQESVQGDGVNGLDPASETETSVTRKVRRKAIQRTSTNESHEEANIFTLENPSFTVTIKRNNWRDYRQDVPSGFVRKYLENKQELKLQYGEKLWPVGLYCYPRNGSGKLSKGWARFARETELVVGDVCEFELINKEDPVPVLHAHIYKD